MSRPTYVRPQDRAKDEAMMTLLVARLNRDCKGTHTYTFTLSNMGYCAYDALIYRNGKLCAIAEHKGRNGSPEAYDEWHLSEKKIEDCQREAAKLQVPFWLIFSWDGVPFFTVPAEIKEPLTVWTSGRTDRSDKYDIERMVKIPRKFFKKI